MNTKPLVATTNSFISQASLLRIATLTALAALAIVPLFAVSSASSSLGTANPKPRVDSTKGGIANTVLLTNNLKLSGHTNFSLTSSLDASIATYAADCTTPKTTFFLGETVCAKTDGVTETDRFVNWCLDCGTSIDYGGAGVTDIDPNNQPQDFLYTPTVGGLWKVTIADSSDSSILSAEFTVVSQTDPIATYAAGCVTPKTTFNLGEVVCAKAMVSATGGYRFAWSGPEGFIRSATPITSDPQTDSYTLPTDLTTTVHGEFIVENRGTWRANILTSRGSARASAFFTVKDADNAAHDLSIFISALTSAPTAGSQVQYSITVKNLGPDAAENVHVIDDTFVNATLDSVTQTGGLENAFTCGNGSIMDCSIASFPAGAEAEFLLNFTAGTAGSTIDNKARVTSDPTELNPDDDDSIAQPLKIGTGETPTNCVLECPNNMTVSANTTEGGNPGAHVTYGNAEAFGTCGTVTMSPASGSFFTVGSHVVSASSTQGGGNCSFTITVIETAPPTITCPANITVAANPGENSAFVPDPNQTGSDPGTPTTTGSGVTVEGQRSGASLSDAYPVGTTTIQWIATDDGGRQATCNQTITVTSADAPTISCPSNKTFTAQSGECTYTATAGEIGTPTTTGPNVTVTSRRSDDLALTDPYPAGQTLITWTATNSVGAASCTQTITVIANDNEPPTLHVPAGITTTTDQCSVLLDDELGVATAEDNCSQSVNISRTGVPRVACPAPGDPNRTCESFVFPTGTTVITYTATDASGNTATGTQTITITEDPAVPPTIDAPENLTVNTGPAATTCGTFVGDATLGTATASDNCPGVTVTRSGVPAGNNFPVGTTTITYRATDASGNFAEDTQTVTVVDNTPPVVTAPAAVTLYTGPGATACDVTVNDLDGTFGTGSATDNCPGVGAVSRSGVPSGNVFPVGTTTLTYSATDAHGNTGSATQVVTVVDNTQPVISCPANITIEPTCPTGAIATYATPTATDNCGVQSVNRDAGSLASGSVFPIGTTTVTHTATDIHGNTSSCSFTVTVLTPQAVVQNLIDSVNASSLTGPQRNGLISKLNAALSAINNGQNNVACPKLSDFVNSVDNLIRHGNISEAQGNAWISSANHVRNTVGCTNLPCS